MRDMDDGLVDKDLIEEAEMVVGGETAAQATNFLRKAGERVLAEHIATEGERASQRVAEALTVRLTGEQGEVVRSAVVRTAVAAVAAVRAGHERLWFDVEGGPATGGDPLNRWWSEVESVTGIPPAAPPRWTKSTRLKTRVTRGRPVDAFVVYQEGAPKIRMFCIRYDDGRAKPKAIAMPVAEAEKLVRDLVETLADFGSEFGRRHREAVCGPGDGHGRRTSSK